MSTENAEEPVVEKPQEQSNEQPEEEVEVDNIAEVCS